MKINFFLPVLASAVLDDTSTLLSVTTQSKAMNLMNAVGHRNVTTMQALVQEIADESVSEPGWKFDDDIKAALQLIRDAFVKNIQKGLKDEHKNDQEHFNCFTKDCFGKCNSVYEGDTDSCAKMGETCTSLGQQHTECRDNVYAKYVDMAQKCGKLHCFEIPDPVCLPENCLCPDLAYCHKKSGDAECVARAGNCKGKYGNFLQTQLARYKEAYEEWSTMHTECKAAYHSFLTVDMECDTTQKQFEKCSCEKSRCDYTTCGIDFMQCTEQCWGRYDELVKEKECLEKDRKIDWSATKKIECYVDVLLHDYTKQELLTKCGSEQCINKAREEDYKDCATVCRKVDHDGDWPSVLSVQPGNVQIEGHAPRSEASQFLLGDGNYKCDVNGAKVFTKHRGGVDRQGEDRCTEHLDFDYQVPECIKPECKKVPICDAAFHQVHYTKYDDLSKIGCISDCCSDDKTTCWDDATLSSSSDGQKLTTIQVSEHSKAWAFNRCECTECVEGFPEYSTPPENHQCGAGAHGFSPIKKACPQAMCMMHCEHGRVQDENGCDLCKCAPAPFQGPHHHMRP
jgi:hypothetical protein